MPEWLRAAPEWLPAKLERLAIAAGATHSTDGMPPEEFLEHIPRVMEVLAEKSRHAVS
jgi:hypothetical protein